MRTITSLAALAAAVLMSAGCGKEASAGQNWIFYSYTESSSDGKNTNKYTVQECANIKMISHASYFPAEASDEKEKTTTLWMRVAGKEIRLHGQMADDIWKSLKNNN